jgi:hypothetical protein
MALLDDSVTIALLTAAAFFVALGFSLLLRYRQVSQKISASSDLGRDLWQALEQRMKKQDERILDMMGRFEVVQSRVMAATAVQALPPAAPLSTPPPSPMQSQEKPVVVMEQSPVVQQPESRGESQGSQIPSKELMLDAMQSEVLKLLNVSPKNTRQLTDALGKSREHTARVMKELYEFGLVSRNDSTKPFVYQLTDEGKRRLS